jgi:superfamily II DNA or RNA helicase
LVGNWIDELLTWDPDNVLGQFRPLHASIKPQDRLQTITRWYEGGGVLVVGYEMFRALIQNKETKSRGAALDEKVHTRVKMELLEGPNIIIADEAHKLKNAKASITTVANQFKSSSRIALTGSPLANNVEEYHTMIDWVAPNYLGPAKEFRFKYVEPIELGLWQDSSSSERRKSLKMLGVLKEDIAPKVHRADMSVLRNDLPPKKEFVIKVPLTEVQRKAYSVYVNSMVSGSVALTKDGQIKQSTLWHWLAVLALLCNHPACFKEKLNERKGDANSQAARIEEMPASKEAAESGEDIEAALNEPIWKVGVSQQLIQDETNLFQAEAVDMKSVNLSYKVKITCQILDAARQVKDKVLVFSQSIPTLNFLEELFAKQGRKFMRLDGKTKMSARQGLTKHFNTGDVEVYLISTTAGGLGLNLPGANRVIIFDFKFNPIQEEQAVGRAYRIGQKKPTFVYRFVVAGTFEDTVHNKTIYKMQLASRVVDKKNPIAHAKKNISDFLFEPRDVEQQDLSNFEGSDPKVLDRILASQKHTNTIRAIVQSDTFEKDDDDKLTAEEEKEVKQLLIDERLKRSDPQAYQELLDKRERIRLRRAAQAAQAAAQASKPVPTAMNSGPHNRAIPTTPQAPPGTAGRPSGQGQAPPMHQRKLNTQGPTVGAGTPKAIGNMPTPISSKLMPSTNPVGAATPKTKPPLNAAPIAGNSGSATSAAIKPPGKGIPDSDSSKDSVPETSSSNQVVTAVSAVSSGAKENQSTPEAVSSLSALPNKNLKDAQLPASYVTPDRPASERVPQLGLPQSPHSSSTSRMTDSESKVR